MAIHKSKGSYIVSIMVILVLIALAYILYTQTGMISTPLLVLLGFALGLVDTMIGMGFGTLGTPILLIGGISSKVAVPSILIAQFLAASFGSILHRKYKNVDVLDFKGRDGKITIAMVGFGLVGAIIGVVLAIKLPSIYVNTYIGALITVMGIVLILKPKTAFSWTKMFGLSIISGFNKAISGGGYGPVSTSGLLATGNKFKNSVGVTVFSVAVINLVSFGIYLLTHSITTFVVMIALSCGAILGSFIGPKITSSVKIKRDTTIIGIVAALLGIITLITTFVKL